MGWVSMNPLKLTLKWMKSQLIIGVVTWIIGICLERFGHQQGTLISRHLQISSFVGVCLDAPPRPLGVPRDERIGAELDIQVVFGAEQM